MNHLSAMPSTSRQPKLLDQVRAMVRMMHYSRRTEEAYVDWIKRFIFFHNKRHPMEMGENEISEFLSHLAVAGNVAASTQNQAMWPIVFLHKHILKKDTGEFKNAKGAPSPPSPSPRHNNPQAVADYFEEIRQGKRYPPMQKRDFYTIMYEHGVFKRKQSTAA